MTGGSPRAPGVSYEEAGRNVASAVRGYSSVIVTSDDVSAAAHTAIGIALAESAHRLVMIGDLAGEAAPLQSLVKKDDYHGIYDSFEFGTSLSRVARPVEGVKNMFVLPSGTESAATERILSSPRWRNFATGFANSDELLLLVAHCTAPGLADLAAQLDGAILVGVSRLDAAPQAHVLTKVPHPTVARTPPPRRTQPVPRKLRPQLSRVAMAAAALLALGIAGGALLAPRSDNGRPATAIDSTAFQARDSALAFAQAMVPLNPQDSLATAPWSVEILAANTAEGASFEIDRHGSRLPAPTISLVQVGETEATWYKVHVGAYSDRVEAEQLLASLRGRGVVPRSAGSVIHAPFTLLIDSIQAQPRMSSIIRERVHSMRARGVTTYAMVQRDGRAMLYAGAFEQPRQSVLAAKALRAAGLAPAFVYRTGVLP